jgi:signal transduction histidine kinase
LLSEEAFAQADLEPLVDWLGRQAPWSDLPILVLAATRADSPTVAQAMAAFGNVTVLERPLRVSALVSAVRAALRARGRQYQAREHLGELERSERELREADRRKDEFLAMLAHELRNPLAPIQNSLHILQLSARHDPAAGRVLPMMQRQLTHIVRLVDDLLEVLCNWMAYTMNVADRMGPCAGLACGANSIPAGFGRIGGVLHDFFEMPTPAATGSGRGVQFVADG